MRLAPVPLFFANDPPAAIARSGDSSRTTHGATEAVDACRYLGGLISGAVSGAGKDELLSDDYAPVTDCGREHPLSPAIAEIAGGSFRRREPPEVRGSGYVVKSLEAALWAFQKTDKFRDGALLAVNLGDDADTTGAVYGQLAGAYYGVSGIPENWCKKLAMRDIIGALADKLHGLSQMPAPTPVRKE